MRTQKFVKKGIICYNHGTDQTDVRSALLAEALELITKLSIEQLAEVMEGIV